MKPDLMQVDHQYGSGMELSRFDNMLAKTSGNQSLADLDNLNT